MFNRFRRKAILEKINETEYDLLVVGGGINGAGVARDAVTRGMKVLVLEARDFAGGTSSRSSKLVHGGIRYLENFEFGLVHEALTERKILLETAPHLVHPLRFVIPIYDSSRVGLFKMELGMIAYDLLSMFEAPQLHEMHFASATQRLEPNLKGEGLSGSVVYSDAYMEDDRLAIEILRSASELGVHALSYAPVNKVEESETGCRVTFTDTLHKQTHVVKAAHVVSCVGPWTDQFMPAAVAKWETCLRPTKGIHLVFPRQRFPVAQAVVMAVEERIVFVIPREDIVIVGTTDTDYKKDPLDVSADESDITYLLGVTNKYFPRLQLTAADVISCYSGVRPLVRDDAKSEGKTSREHKIFTPTPRITAVAGGKYTTYRAMAEQVVDAVLARQSFETRNRWKKPNTATPINPRATQEKINRLLSRSKGIADDFQVPEELVLELARRHGEEAYILLNYMRLFTSSSPLGPEERRWLAEAKFSIENGMCFHLTDFYWRRSPLFLFHADNGMRFLRPLASVFASTLGWSPEEEKAEVAAVLDQMAHDKEGLRRLVAAR